MRTVSFGCNATATPAPTFGARKSDSGNNARKQDNVAEPKKAQEQPTGLLAKTVAFAKGVVDFYLNDPKSNIPRL